MLAEAATRCGGHLAAGLVLPKSGLIAHLLDGSDTGGPFDARSGAEPAARWIIPVALIAGRPAQGPETFRPPLPCRRLVRHHWRRVVPVRVRPLIPNGSAHVGRGWVVRRYVSPPRMTRPVHSARTSAGLRQQGPRSRPCDGPIWQTVVGRRLQRLESRLTVTSGLAASRPGTFPM